ncbi:hypothetical protein JCM10213_003047 [Rhodosporidiobolus nylandii]
MPVPPLPVELLPWILRDLPPAALASCCLTSRTFLSVARPLLNEHLILTFSALSHFCVGPVPRCGRGGPRSRRAALMPASEELFGALERGERPDAAARYRSVEIRLGKIGPPPPPPGAEESKGYGWRWRMFPEAYLPPDSPKRRDLRQVIRAVLGACPGVVELSVTRLPASEVEESIWGSWFSGGILSYEDSEEWKRLRKVAVRVRGGRGLDDNQLEKVKKWEAGGGKWSWQVVETKDIDAWETMCGSKGW